MFALASFLRSAECASGRVIVWEVDDESGSPSENTLEMPSAQAQFGPIPPEKGLIGTVQLASPLQACTPIARAKSADSIALIERGPSNTSCYFVNKVKNAQDAGFIAAIVYDDIYEGSLAQMDTDQDTHISIPSVFISKSSGLQIQSLMNHTGSTNSSVIAQIYPDYVLVRSFLFTFVTIVAGTSIIFTLFLFYRRHMMLSRRTRRQIMTRREVVRLPSRSFRPEDADETCCICLDNYKRGHVITILPCKHIFHKKCIRPWLEEQNRVCPICKQDPMELMANQSAGADERSPLLASSSVIDDTAPEDPTDDQTEDSLATSRGMSTASTDDDGAECIAITVVSPTAPAPAPALGSIQQDYDGDASDDTDAVA